MPLVKSNYGVVGAPQSVTASSQSFIGSIIDRQILQAGGGGSIGAGGAGGVTISNVAITDSTFANVLSGDTAVGSSGGFVRITGTGFQVNAGVFFNNTRVANTFVSSTQINANIPATTAGSYNFYVFNTDGSGANFVSGLVTSGFPAVTTTYSIEATSNTQIIATGDAPLTFSIKPGSVNTGNFTVNAAGYLGAIAVADSAYTLTVLVEDAQNQTTQADLTITVATADPYFRLTTTALPADTSYWIQDASTNKFVLTVNGDARPNAFSPYETVWSNYFDGSGDYITVPANAAFDFGTGDFTLECWIYSLANQANFAGVITNWTSATGFYFSFAGGSNNMGFSDFATYYINPSSVPISNNVWTHVAVTRSGTTLRMFFNGQIVGTALNNTVVLGGATGVTALGSNGGTSFNGYISDARIIKGTALYTSAFTPPTTQLTAISGTSLLTCQSNRLRDASTNNFTITRNGDVAVSNFGPFVETDTTTGSAYFDGTGDYLTVPTNAALDFGTGDFTVECWWYPTSVATDQGFLGGVTGAYDFCWRTSTGFNLGRINVAFDNTFAFTAVANIWYHVAYSRSGTNLRVFVNGAQVGSTATNSISYGTNGGTAVIGGSTTADRLITGRISNMRLLKGTALYTANFTPPTSPLTAVSGTSLLTLQNRLGENNNRIVDTSGINSIVTRNGNATQGTFSPFSPTGWSNYFDGTGDYLTAPNNAAFAFGTGDFTVEGWYYLNSGVTRFCLYDSGSGGSGGQFAIFQDSATGFFVRMTSDVTFGSPPAPGQWVHFAVTRSGTTVRLFFNGTQAATGTQSTNVTNTTPYIGFMNGFGSYIMNGYISNLRVLKGTALYTSAFTPPTAPLTAIANTSLLTCQSNRLRDASNNNFTITRNGDVSVQAFSPLAPAAEYNAVTHSGSGYFDGSDFLTYTHGSELAFGTGDFTIEYWMYANSAVHQGILQGDINVGWGLFVLSGTLYWQSVVNQVNRLTASVAAYLIPAWRHWALVRSSGTLSLYIDGQLITSVSDSTNYSDAAGTFYIGQVPVLGIYINGYLSDLRIVKGTALYTANFTPPTSQLTATAGTSLLLNFTNAGITDATAKNVFETFGDVKLSTAQSKFGGSSMLFDGTGDYVAARSNQTGVFGTGDFTIEGWFYWNSIVSESAIVWNNDGATGRFWTFYIYPANKLQWGKWDANMITGATTLATGQWYHIAATRASGTVRLFVNGVVDGSATDTTDYYSTGFVELGRSHSNYFFNGYVDDFRITKGYARYIANFTPPATTFKLR